jgi:hypothetical protein
VGLRKQLIQANGFLCFRVMEWEIEPMKCTHKFPRSLVLSRSSPDLQGQPDCANPVAAARVSSSIVPLQQFFFHFVNNSLQHIEMLAAPTSLRRIRLLGLVKLDSRYRNPLASLLWRYWLIPLERYFHFSACCRRGSRIVQYWPSSRACLFCTKLIIKKRLKSFFII